MGELSFLICVRWGGEEGGERETERDGGRLQCGETESERERESDRQIDRQRQREREGEGDKKRGRREAGRQRERVRHDVRWAHKQTRTGSLKQRPLNFTNGGDTARNGKDRQYIRTAARQTDTNGVGNVRVKPKKNQIGGCLK